MQACGTKDFPMGDDSVLHENGGKLSIWRRHSLHVHIAAIFFTLLLAACGMITWTNYQQGKRVVLASAEDLLEQIEQRTSRDIQNLRAPVATVVNLLSQGPLMDADSFDARFRQVGRLADLLKHHDSVAAVYFAYYNGDFFLLRPLRDEAARKQFAAPRHAAFLVQSIERKGGMRKRFVLLDAALNTIW